MADYDEKEDLMDRLLALGRRKKGLSLDQLHRELPENMMSADDIEDVLERLEGANISVAETDAQLLERASSLALDDEEEEVAVDEDDLDLDLSAGVLDKSNDPVRLYLREMGIVPLLNREGEVTIAKRIERGQIKTHKAISRSPIAVERLLKIGDDLVDRQGEHSRNRGFFGAGRDLDRGRQGRRIYAVDARGYREHPRAFYQRSKNLERPH